MTSDQPALLDLLTSPSPAQMGFLLIGYPSLVITYFGQAAYLWQHPENYASAFYSSVPGPIFWPVFVLATLATIVASQAMISGAFSIIKQSMSLSCFPKVRIIHTSKTMEGQIYIPEINYVFMVLTIAVVVGFRDSTQIGNAYGEGPGVPLLSVPDLVVRSSQALNLSPLNHSHATANGI